MRVNKAVIARCEAALDATAPSLSRGQREDALARLVASVGTQPETDDEALVELTRRVAARSTMANPLPGQVVVPGEPKERQDFKALARGYARVAAGVLGPHGWPDHAYEEKGRALAAAHHGLTPFGVEHATRAVEPLIPVAVAFGALRARAGSLGMARPRTEPPADVVAAWHAGDLATCDAWLQARTAAAIGAHATPSDVAAMARQVRDGDDAAIDRVERATKPLRGDLARRAVRLFETSDETRADAEALSTALVALVATRAERLAAERAEDDRRRKARRVAREERFGPKAGRMVTPPFDEGNEAAGNAAVAVAALVEGAATTERRRADKPVNRARLPAMLGATKVEVERWIGDGRIPTYGRVAFRKWGRTLETTEHATPVVEALRDEVEGWRAADAAAAREQRVEAARTAAVTRQGRGFRTRVAAAAGAIVRDDALVVPGVAVAPPVDAAIAFAPLFVRVRTRWPEGFGGLTEAGEPVSVRAEEAMARELAETVDAFREECRTAAAAAVDQGLRVATETGHDSDEASRRRFAHHVDHALSALGGHDVAFARAAHLTAAIRNAFVEAVKAMSKERAKADVRGRTGLDDYTALFPVARAMRRRIVLHIGPTNAGKTHSAMADLAEAASGTYLAPLRLMALEAYDTLCARGVAARMVTGEERVGDADAPHVAATIEMVDLDRPVAVAVVDEAQMILDPSRGWAWTQALVGLPADLVHVTGSPDCVGHVSRIAALTGDELEIVMHERLTPLTAETKPITEVETGDAIVAFSRVDVLRLRESLSHLKVATIYGALGPEVRRAEAARFRSSEADVLIATDAIAMGLNLPIRRVLFHRLTKFDGVENRDLNQGEIRQIAGRAGRHGFAEAGIAGVLDAALGGEAKSGRPIAAALTAVPRPPSDLRLPVMPPWRAVDAIAQRRRSDDLAAILREVAGLLAADPLLATADMEVPLAIAKLTARTKLSLRDRFRYLGAPHDLRSEAATWEFARWAREHGEDGRPTPPPSEVGGVPGDTDALQRCEGIVRRMSTYLWLSERWPAAYRDAETVRRERGRVNGLIEAALASKGLSRRCGGCGRRLGTDHRFPTCEACFSRADTRPRHERRVGVR